MHHLPLGPSLYPHSVSRGSRHSAMASLLKSCTWIGLGLGLGLGLGSGLGLGLASLLKSCT